MTLYADGEHTNKPSRGGPDAVPGRSASVLHLSEVFCVCVQAHAYPSCSVGTNHALFYFPVSSRLFQVRTNPICRGAQRTQHANFSLSGHNGRPSPRVLLNILVRAPLPEIDGFNWPGRAYAPTTFPEYHQARRLRLVPPSAPWLSRDLTPPGSLQARSLYSSFPTSI